MASIQRFEDIESWMKARELTAEVYKLTCDGPISRDFRFVGQLRSASVSVMSNIAEGFERDGNAEFRNFLYIAKASAREVRSLLYVALDAKFIQQDEFDRLSKLVFEVV